MQKAIELNVNGRVLRGMRHEPETAGKHPVAVIYHGFSGNKVEPHFIFVKLSRALEAAGIASVRFDFGGSGESDGEFVDMTFGGEVAEAKAILDYARSLPGTDADRVFLVGFSMGGAVASVVAGDEAAKVRAAALWAAAGTMAESFMVARADAKNRAAMERDGRVDLGGLWLGRGFVQEIAGWDIFSHAARFPGRVLLIHGDADESVPLSVSHRYQEIYGDRAQLHVIGGANHTFNRADWEEEAVKRTVEFLREESGAAQQG